MVYLVFSLIWSLGANIHDKSRIKFDKFFKTELASIMPDFPDGDIFDYGIDTATHRFEPWSD